MKNAQSNWTTPKGWLGLCLISLAVAGFKVAWAAEAGSGPVRAAILDFACDDLSYKSWESAKAFTALLQAALPVVPEIEWVERSRLERAEQELELSLSGLNAPEATVRVGHWAGAQWVLRGGFSANQAGQRQLRLELVDVVHAELLGATNLNFAVEPRSRLEIRPNWVAETASLLGGWLPGQRLRWQAQQQQLRVMCLPSINANNPLSLWNECRGLLAEDAPGFRLALPGQTRAAIEEADLGLLGLTGVGDEAWRRVADFYVWWGQSLSGTNGAGANGPTWQVWDGRSAPVPLPRTNAAPALAEFLRTRKPAVLAQRFNTAAGDAWRRAISDALAGELAQRKELGRYYSWSPETRRSWEYLVRVLETAAFIDPANGRVREAWVRARWNPVLEYSAESRHRFRRARSDAWAAHVQRFGTNVWFSADSEPVGYHAVMSTLAALSVNSDRLQDGVPVDLPASMEVQWRRELKERLAELLSLFYTEPALAPYRANLMNTVAYDEPTDPVIRAQALDKLLGELVKNPTTFGFVQWDPPASNGVVRIFKAAGRAAEGIRWLEQVNAAVGRSRATEIAAARPEGSNSPPVKVPLPRTSALHSLDIKPAFDAGEIDLAPPAVQARVARVPLPATPAVERLCQLAPGQQALWVVGEAQVAPTAPIRTEVNDVALRPTQGKERFLWRVDLQSHAVSRQTNGIGTSEPWCAAELGNELWIGLDRGEVVAVDLAKGTHQVARKPDFPAATNWSRRVLLREGSAYEEATSPVAAIAKVNDTVFASAVVLNRLEATESRWIEVLPRGSRGELLTATALNRWLAVSGGYLLARYGQLTVVDGTSHAWQPFQPRWAGGEKLLRPSSFHTAPVGDGHGGFWVGLRDELVWFDTTGSNVWRTAYEPPLSVKRDGYWLQHAKIFGMKMEEEFRPEELQGLQRQWARRQPGALLASRLPGLVTALATEADWLWVATAKGETWREGGYRVSLLHMPSRRWVGSMALEARVLSLCVTSNEVWLATEMSAPSAGESPLHRMDKRPWLEMPTNRWVSAEVTLAEVAAAEQRLTSRQQGLRKLFRGEPEAFIRLYAGRVPATLDPETLFLLAQAYAAPGLNQAERRQEMERTLMEEFPESVFGRWLQEDQRQRQVREQLRERTPPDSNDLARRLEELFARYDENKDGELGPAEAGRLVELEPDQLSVPLPRGLNRTAAGELLVMMRRRHAGPGLNREELRSALRGAPAAFPVRPAGSPAPIPSHP